MTIGLYLMNQKGWSTLKVLIENNLRQYIGYVVADRDLSVENDFYLNIAEECSTNGIPHFSRKDKSLPSVNYKLAIGWRWLIEESENLIVLHDSVLPKYRGFAPLVNTLIKGDTEIGVTAIFAEADFDTGEVLFQEKSTISYPVKIQAAIETISVLYHRICLDLFRQISLNQVLVSQKQNEADASYSIWRDEEDYRINWSEPAATIKRFIDAVGFPYKGAQALIEGKVVHINDAVVYPDLSVALRHPGKVLMFVQDKPVVICGEGLLLITEMREPNGDLFKLKKFRTRFK